MRHRSRVLAVALVVGLAAVGCTDGTTSISGAATPLLGSPWALRAYDSCGGLLEQYQQAALDRVGPYGFDQPTARIENDVAVAELAPAAGADATSRAPVTTYPPSTTTTYTTPTDNPTPAPTDGSTQWGGTNVQVAGVDEPDVVKTAGNRLLTLTDGTLRAVEVSSGTPVELDALSLDPGAGGYGQGQLLVAGDRALVLAAAQGPTTMGPELRAPASVAPPTSGPQVTVTEIDISDLSHLSTIGSVSLDGSLVDARLVDGMVRLVTTTGGPTLDLVYPSSARSSALNRAEQANQAIIRSTTIDDWLPRYQVRDASGDVVADRPLVDCASVDVPQQPDGAGALNLVSIDLQGSQGPTPSGTVSVVGAGQTVYATTTDLYVAAPDTSDTGAPGTTLHRFSIEGRGPATYLASGHLDGTLLDQFSMSDQGGHLRVATTRTTPTGNTDSAVTVLDTHGDSLDGVGQVDGLGHGEQIYSVRFVGDVGYVVTFRRTDPLYTVDLSDPTAPAVVGELEMNGYSSYLQPIGDGLLVGIGQDATGTGRVTGTQLALFDVRDPAHPARVQQLTLPTAWSTAENDHHAFTWWPDGQLAVVPVASSRDGFVGAVGFRISSDELTELGRIVHPASGASGTSEPCPYAGDCGYGNTPIDRSVIVDDTIVTVSAAGVKVTDPASFGDLGWLAFG